MFLPFAYGNLKKGNRKLLLTYSMIRHMHLSVHSVDIGVWDMLRPQIRVLSLPVSSKVHLPLEGPSAQITGEGLEPRVLAGMGDQVRALAEGFATDLTLMRLLAC